MKTLILAADHAGFEIKETIKKHFEAVFKNSGDDAYDIVDVGAHQLNPEDDYPVYMSDAAMKVATDISGNTKAIVFGGSGNGEAIVCNRFPGVRAVVWYGGNIDIVKLSREHNDANILSIGARFVTADEAIKAISLWLTTSFSAQERHLRRIELIDNIE